jgi:predicted secreted protein
MGSEVDDAIELRVGEEHSVTLSGLGTAGYRWAAEVEGDSGVVDIARADGEPPAAGAGVGASASEAFTLRAKRPGSIRIRFAQRRPWDRDDVPPANERTIRLRVS